MGYHTDFSGTVNGQLGFNVELTDDGFEFYEDDGGEASGYEIIRADEVQEVEWDGSLDHCHVLMKDGQGWEFTSHYYNQRSIPEG